MDYELLRGVVTVLECFQKLLLSL